MKRSRLRLIRVIILFAGAALLAKSEWLGDFSSRLGTVKTSNTTADYERAVSRIGKQVRAAVITTKGSFTIELLPEDAPLTVDNFVQLAKRNLFQWAHGASGGSQLCHSGGDPRGDGNGGPGYQIRCEINEGRTNAAPWAWRSRKRYRRLASGL